MTYDKRKRLENAIDLAEAAQKIGITRKVLAKYAKKGTFYAWKAGNKWKTNNSAVREYIEKHSSLAQNR